MNCISDFAFLPVNCFKSFCCVKKRHERNKSVEIVHELQFLTTYYRNTNDVSTHAWPRLILHGPQTWHCKFVCLFVCFFCFFCFVFFVVVVQDHVVTKSRYTSFMPASENDHSNFYICSLSLPSGTLAVIKGGVYKSSLFIFHGELYSISNDFSLTSWI